MYVPFISPYLTGQHIKLLLGIMGGSVILNGVLWWLTLTFFPRDSTAILHYTIDVGVDFIGEGKQITSLPLIATAVILFNAVMGVALLRADTRASWLLWCTMPLAQLVLLLAFYLLREVNL